MSVQVVVRETDEGRRLRAELAKLEQLEVAVGILEDSGVNEEGTKLVDIALWNEYGTYAAPARPFVNTTPTNYADQINAALEEGINTVLEGGSAEQAMDTVGVVGKAAMQQNVVDGGFAENSEFTINGGWMHNKKSGKLFWSDGKLGVQPLVNTGYMRGQINYIVRPKNSGGDG